MFKSVTIGQMQQELHMPIDLPRPVPKTVLYSLR